MKSQTHTPRRSAPKLPAFSSQKKIALGFILAATFSTAANAASVYWTGTNGSTASWANAANWNTGSLPSSTDGVNFGTGATQTIALNASQTINSLTFSTANSNYTIGTAADIASGYVLTLTNVYRSSISGGTQVIATNVLLAANSLWEIASGYNSYLQVNGSIGGSGLSLTKISNGTLVLAAANAYSGGTIIKQGTLNLAFSQSASPLNDILLNGSTLTMLGGGLAINGKSAAGSKNVQTLGTLNVSAGASSLAITAGNATNSVLLNLGTISRSAGATISLSQPTVNTTVGASNGYTTTTSNDASGILGAWATISGTTWATNNGTNIVAYTGYTDLSGDSPTLADGATSNVRINSASTGGVGQISGTTTINSLLVNDSTARTITIGTGNTLRLGSAGGVLAPAGTGALTIGAAGNAGTLTAGGADNTAGEIIFTNAVATTVNAVIADNGSGVVTLTKSGSGLLTLSATNTYSGGTYVNSGTLTLVTGTNILNTAGNITVSGGILNLGGGVQNVSGSVTIAGGTITSGTMIKTGAAYDAQLGTMTGVFSGTSGLIKTTAGWLTFSGTGSYTGDTQVLEGTFNLTGKLNNNIYVGSAGGTASASFTTNGGSSISAKDVTVYSNGSFSLGNSVHAGNVTINGGSMSSIYGYVDSTITMTGGVVSGGIYGTHNTITTKASDTTAVFSAGNSMATTNTYNIADGTAAIDLDVTGGIAGNYGIIKTGAGLMSLDSGNSYTGNTTVSAGTLRIGNGTSGSISNSGTISVASGAIVAFNQADGTSYAGVIANSGTIAAIASGSNTLSGVIKGTGKLVQSGLGTTILSGVNTYSGGTVVNSGSLVLGTASALGTGLATVSGGTLNLGGFSITNTLDSFTGGAIDGGTITNNGGTYDLQNGTISAALAGSNGLTKSTSGTVALTGTNTYTGATTVSAGVLELGADGSIDATPSITIASGAIFDVSGKAGYSYAGTLSGNGAVNGAIISNGTISGALTFNGDVTVGSAATASAGAFNGNVIDNGTITSGIALQSGKTLSGSGSVSGDVSVTSGTVNGTNLSVTGATTFNGASTLAGSMTSGAGISVASNGTLNVTGHTTSGVTVTNAILKGTGSTGAVALVGGTLNGTLSTGAISGTGLVSPGGSPGILTATSVSSTVAGGLLDFAFELTAAAPDYTNATGSLNDILHITTTGGLTLEAGTNISVYFETLSAGSSFAGGFFVDGMTTAALLSAISNATFSYYVQDAAGSTLFNGINYSLVDATQIAVSAINAPNAAFGTGSVSGAELEFTVVPEPSTWAMIAGGFGLLAFGQRLRRKSQSPLM